MIKFKKNSFVYIKKLGDCKKHFPQERVARVNYTYYEKYGGNSDRCKQIYDLKIRYDDGTWVSGAWYEENELEEITCSIKINEYLKELEEPIKQTIKLYTVPYEERWGRW